MRRRLANLIGLVAGVAVVVTAAVWARGWWRADVVSVVTRGHVYCELDQHEGYIRALLTSRWPASPSARWSMAAATFDFDSSAAVNGTDPLVGPEMWTFLTERQWWRFTFGTGPVEYRATGGRPLTDEPRRGWKFYSGPDPETTPPLPTVAVTVPCWMPPMTALAVATLWAGVVGGTRGRRWLRRRRHQCVDCGYDLRHTPDRCPECGATAAV